MLDEGVGNSMNSRQVVDSDISATAAIAQYKIAGLVDDLAGKQVILVSGSNIRPVNGQSLLGSGNLIIGDSANVEELSANKTLTATDVPIQIYTCTANRTITLPTTGLTVGQKFEIWNVNANNTSHLIYISCSGSSIPVAICGKSVRVHWNGSKWISSESLYSISIGFGATGNHSSAIAIGGNSSYNQNFGVAIGDASNWNGESGVGVGKSTTMNRYCAVGVGTTSTSNDKRYNTVAIGAYSKAERNREFISTATDGTTNKAQLTIQKFKEQDLSTAAAAWQELFIDAVSARLVIIASSVYNFRAQINAIDKTTFDVKTWEITGSIKRDASNATSLVGTPTVNVISADTNAANWDARITADDTNESLKIEAKHDSANQVRYSLNIYATETRI